MYKNELRYFLYFVLNTHQIFMWLTQTSQYYSNCSKAGKEHFRTGRNLLNLLFLQLQKVDTYFFEGRGGKAGRTVTAPFTCLRQKH